MTSTPVYGTSSGVRRRDSSDSFGSVRGASAVRIYPQDVERTRIRTVPPSGVTSTRHQSRGPGVRGSFEKGAPDSNARRADEVSGRRVASRRAVPVPCRADLTTRAGVNLKMAETRDSTVVSGAVAGAAAASGQQPTPPESGAQADEDPSGRTGT